MAGGWRPHVTIQNKAEPATADMIAKLKAFADRYIAADAAYRRIYYYLTADDDTPIDPFGGHSMIVDYRGQIVGSQRYGGVSTSVCGPVNIEALRHHRATSPWTNWMKDLRTELYQLLYERPIYPKNLYLKRAPMKHAEYRQKVIRRQIRLMHDRGIWARPAR